MLGTNYFRATSIFALCALIWNESFGFGACQSSVSRQTQTFYEYTINEPTIQWEGLRLNLDYTFSKSVEDEIISYSLSTNRDCQGGFIPDNEILSNLIELSSNSIRISLLLNPENIGDASYINNFESHSTIGFCARVWIDRPPTTLDGEAITVSAPRDDFFTIKADLADLVTGITEVLDERSINWSVNVFRCNDSNQKLDSPNAVTNGEKFRLCFKANARAWKDNVFIKEIRYFHFLRGDVIQRATTSFGTDQVTEVFCTPGKRTCAIETVLSNDFFFSPGQVLGDGVVYLQYGNQNSRTLRSVPVNLRASVNARSLQDSYTPGQLVSQKPVNTILDVVPTSKTYEAEAFPCNEKNRPENRKVLLRGQDIKICIQPTEEAIAAGVFINAIESFSYGRSNDETAQLALDSYGRVADGNQTSVSCTSGSVMCTVRTTLDGVFFDQDSEMAVSGYVVLQYGALRERRRLAILSSSDLGFAGRSEVQAFFETVGSAEGAETIKGPFESWFEGLFEKWDFSDTHMTIAYVVAGVLFVLLCCCCCACIFFFFLFLRRRREAQQREIQNTVNIKYADYEHSNSHSTDNYGDSHSQYDEEESAYSEEESDEEMDEESENADYSENPDDTESADSSEDVEEIPTEEFSDAFPNPDAFSTSDAFSNSDPFAVAPVEKKKKKKKKKKSKKKKKLRDVAEEESDEEDDAENEDESTPRKKDVCFDAEDHPGTKKLVKVIQATIKENGPEPYSPAIYKKIKRKLSGRRFFLCDQDLNDATAWANKKYEWREAEKREIIDIFWKYYEEERNKV